ncbi:TlpA disulfide reductase family protein [Sphingobacterium tabacisoli]|uniref:Redoxin domain-containing protein n=1 Tax=Sphingobacterium tabacisoli TaxID=2044855 RepID=A0ABW5L0T0_9SPHI|nr:TlpA disulfide reductase family protein [Sphingobacterium tabacisoli]
MRKLLYTGLAILCSQMALGQLKVKVVGTVTGDTEGHNMVYFYNRMAKDSATIKNGKFEINVNEPVAGSRAISIQYDQAKRRMYSPLVLFYDQSGTINVAFDVVKGLSSATIKGMPSAVTYYNYNADKPKVFMGARQATITKYGEEALKKGNAQFETATTYQNELINKGYDSVLNKYFDGNKVVSTTLVLSTLSNLSTAQAEDYYNRLSDKLKTTEEGKTLYAKIEGLKNAYIGAVVKDFQLPNEKSEKRSFSEFKGKYVLLDFWASWCSPCRASFPRIREVYSKLQGKNFEIVNISIDQNKQAWLKAVQEESNPWPQLYDDTKISSSLFNVSAVPTSYLIDPSGKIIMKEIGFEPKGGGEMEKKLEEIFKVKF